MEAARSRQKRVELATKKKESRSQRVQQAAAACASAGAVPVVERDGGRVLASTRASEAARLTHEDLDLAEHQRAASGAHGARLPMSGRDLAHAGRAVPTWRRGLA